MKRSEMLDIMQPFFNIKGSDRQKAKMLLDAMENAGMTPPCFEIGPHGDVLHTNELLDYMDINYQFKWEPENETK